MQPHLITYAYNEPANMVNTVEFIPKKTGFLKCEAKNAFGANAISTSILILQKRESLMFELEPEQFISGDNATIHCFASKHVYKNSLSLSINGSAVQGSEGFTMDIN